MRTRILLIGLAFVASLAAYAQTPATNTAAPATATDAGPAPTAFVVKIKVKPGQNEAFEKLFRETQAGVRANEPGNVYYDLYRDKDPQTYVVLEHYKDAAAVEAHRKDPAVQKMIAGLRDMLDGRPDAQTLVLVSAK